MLELFNNSWIILVCAFLIYSIYKKIKNLSKPLEETKFIEQMGNQQKLKKHFSLANIANTLPTVASYYVGII